MINSNFILGSDPEFLGYDTKRKKPVSLIGLLGGTKQNPKKIDVEGCFIQEDNVNCEFTVPPQTEFYALHNIIDECIIHTNKNLAQYNYKLVAKSSARYSEKELDNEIAKMFGCDPSFCTYTNGITIVPGADAVENLRCSGFHIHFGWDTKFKEGDYKKFVMLCDIFLGVPSLIVDRDKERRLIYGSLGDFRLPEHGVEYRTLGSGMYNYPSVINDGISMIKRVIDSDAEDFFLESLSDDMYMLHGERSINYKSKNKLWKKISSLYMEL